MITGVSVRVPATVANVGPGFDILAFALDWHNEIHIQPASQLEITVEGNGAAEISTGPDNLVARSIERIAGAVPRAHIRIVNTFPFGRGFGSSAAAIAGGLAAGLVSLGERFDAHAILDTAVEIEGHADNVTACLLGGFTISYLGTKPARLDPPPGWSVVVAVAPGALSTKSARAALPETLSLIDAVATSARTARLVAAVAQADIEAVFAATHDVVHQPARFALAPESGEIVAKLRGAGHAAFLSGAGPSVAAIVSEDQSDAAVTEAKRAAPDGWDVRLVGFSATGAEIIVSA